MLNKNFYRISIPIILSLILLVLILGVWNFQKDKNYFLRWYYKTFPNKLSEISIFESAKDKKNLKLLLEVYGPRKIMEKLLEESGNGYIKDCHQEAHIIGKISYEIYGPEAFKEGNAACHSGFYHGAMEAFLIKEGTSNLTSKIKNICKIFPTSFGVFECFHGVGHGVMAYMDYDLPQALEICSSLSDSFYKSACYGGVFMENIIVGLGQGVIRGHKTDWLNNDPHFPCNAIDKSYDIQYQCYLMQTSWMFKIFNKDYDKVAMECLRSNPKVVDACFRSYGRDVAGNVLRDPQKIYNLCNKVPREYFDECIIGALNVIVDFWGEKLNDQATILCKIVPEENKKRCYDKLSERLWGIFYSNSDRIKICETFEPYYKDRCIDLFK